MENRTVEYRAEGTMVRDVNWLNSSHGITLTALEEVASQNMIGDMLRYDDGEIISGQFNGKWTPKGAPTGYAPGDAPIIGGSVGMEGEVEPVASSIKFSVVIKAERWTPARWDSFGVKTKLIKGDLSAEMLQDDLDHQTKRREIEQRHKDRLEVMDFWVKAFKTEEPEIIIDDIEIHTINGKFVLTQDQQPIPGVDGTHRFKTLQDAVDAALIIIMQRTMDTRVHKWVRNILWSHRLILKSDVLKREENNA